MSSTTVSSSLASGVEPYRNVDEAAGAGTLWLYTLTTLLSALLLFSIQPMFAKMVLPVLGGSPSVWAVALAFFQGALLAGYCYAHGLMRFLPAKMTGLVHLTFCVFAFLALPIALPESWQEPPPGDAYFWQFGLFAVAIGVPFMAVAANAPLLQAWFARSGHAQSANPYFLYAASNLGSFFALLGYPLLLEPAFGVSTLSNFWVVGYVALIAGVGACFAVVWRRQDAHGDSAVEVATDREVSVDDQPTWQDRLTWIGLAMVPAALLTAFTSHIATDVASAPLIWVIPLALYLLTFVIVFRDGVLTDPRDENAFDLIGWLHIITVFLVFLKLSQMMFGGWFLSSSLGFSAFMASTLVAHRTLYYTRPSAASLTEFYLWMSFGGVLGGLFAALVAPQIFSEVFEYPLILALTLACRYGVVSALRSCDSSIKIGALQAGLGLAFVVSLAWIAAQMDWDLQPWGVAPLIIFALAGPLFFYARQPVSQLAMALIMVAALVFLPSAVHLGNAERSYFGVYRILKSDDGQFTILRHGSTLHGAQRRHDAAGNPVDDTTPATYYYSGGPMHDALAYVQARHGDTAQGRYGIVGLGAGAMACHARAGETWRFYEIDPKVVDLAKSKNFSYMEKCQPEADIVIGDARLTLAKEPDHSFDYLVIDAFSSDAVPMHLLTKEALQLYLSKLKPDGVGVLHISNRYLDLEGVLHATLAKIDGVHAAIIGRMQFPSGYAKTSSQVAVLTKQPDIAASFMKIPEARAPRAADIRAWTDDASDILGPLLSKLKQY